MKYTGELLILTLLFIVNSRVFFPKNDSGSLRNVSASVVLLLPLSRYVERNVALYCIKFVTAISNITPTLATAYIHILSEVRFLSSRSLISIYKIPDDIISTMLVHVTLMHAFIISFAPSSERAYLCFNQFFIMHSPSNQLI